MTPARMLTGLACALLLSGCGPGESDPVASPANEAATANAAAGGSSDAPPAPPAAPAPPAPPRPSAWSPTGYALNGTEPFRGGRITGTSVLYQTPENQAGETVAASAAYAPDREVYSGTLDGRPFVVTLTRGPCSNGMSEQSFAYTAVVQVRGETRNGCAGPPAR